MRSLVAILVGTTLASCGQSSAPPERQSERPAAARPATAAPVDDATLLVPGAEPRTVLRYAIADGTSRTVDWQMQAPEPPMTLHWRYDFHRQGEVTTVAMRVLAGGPLSGDGRWRFSDRGRHELVANDARVALQQTQAELMLPILP